MAKQPTKLLSPKKKMAMSNYSGSATMQPMAPAACMKKGGKVKGKKKK